VSNPTNMSHASGQLLLTVDGPLATLAISYPQRRNAMTRAMWRDLQGIGARLPVNVRCLVIRGQGEHFSAGGDISEYPDFRFEENSLAHFHEEEVAPGLAALLKLDIPVVAMINGFCMGGGLEIAACADIRIASEDASFGAPIAKLGMPMALRELALLLSVAGEATVREMLLEASTLSAQEMKARGFVQRLVRADELEIEAQKTAERIAALSPQAAQLNKQALRQFLDQYKPLAGIKYAQIAINSIVNDAYAYASSAEHIEGITAFLQKRSPNF
jgi:enoyl-CoA hydratase/carnithine racemase